MSSTKEELWQEVEHAQGGSCPSLLTPPAPQKWVCGNSYSLEVLNFCIPPWERQKACSGWKFYFLMSSYLYQRCCFTAKADADCHLSWQVSTAPASSGSSSCLQLGSHRVSWASLLSTTSRNYSHQGLIWAVTAISNMAFSCRSSGVVLFNVESGSLARSCIATSSQAQISIKCLWIHRSCIASEPVPGKLLSILRQMGKRRKNMQ